MKKNSFNLIIFKIKCLKGGQKWGAVVFFFALQALIFYLFISQGANKINNFFYFSKCKL